MRLFSILFVCVCALFAAVSVNAAEPGVRLQVKSKAMTKVANYVLPKIVKKLQKIVVKGKKSSHYSYSNLKLTGLRYDTVKITSKSGLLTPSITGLGIKLERMSFNIYGKVGWIKVTCRGHASAKIEKTNVDLSVKLSNDGGKPYAKIDDKVKIGKIHISRSWTTSGCRLAEKIVKLFVGDLNKKLISALKDQVSPMLRKAINPAVNNALKELVLKQKVASPDITAYYDLVGSITINSDGVSLGVRGLINSAGKPLTIPTEPVSNPAHTLTQDIEFNVQDYTVNSASVNLLANMQGSKKWIKTTDTKSYPVIGPLLYGKCPGCQFQIDYRVRKAPVFNTSSSLGIQVSVPDFIIGIKEIAPDGKLIAALEAFVTATASAKAQLNGDATKLSSKYACQAFTITELRSHIGNIEIGVLNPLIKRIIDEVLVPIANEKFSVIPMPAIKSTHAKVSSIVNSYQSHILTLKGNLDFDKQFHAEIAGDLADMDALYAAVDTVENDAFAVTETFEDIPAFSSTESLSAEDMVEAIETEAFTEEELNKIYDSIMAALV